MYSAIGLVFVVAVAAATLSGKGRDNVSSVDSFKECLVSRPQGGLGYCIGYGALSQLQAYENDAEFDLVDGVTFTKDETMYRDGGFNVLADADPSNFRTIIDTMGQVISKRSVRWDMGYVYPGLVMRLAPSAVSAGHLEFAMDPHKDAFSLKEASTARVLSRQFLLPFLLGLKFNVATLIPIIFGIIALLAKKALFLSKIALVISSAFGIGSLLFGTHQQPSYSHGYQPTYNPSFGGHHTYRYPEEDYHDTAYRANTNAYTAEDQLRLYQTDAQLQQVLTREDKKGRNFAWSEEDKTKKTK